MIHEHHGIHYTRVLSEYRDDITPSDEQSNGKRNGCNDLSNILSNQGSKKSENKNQNLANSLQKYRLIVI